MVNNTNFPFTRNYVYQPICENESFPFFSKKITSKFAGDLKKIEEALFNHYFESLMGDNIEPMDNVYLWVNDVMKLAVGMKTSDFAKAEKLIENLAEKIGLSNAYLLLFRCTQLAYGMKMAGKDCKDSDRNDEIANANIFFGKQLEQLRGNPNLNFQKKLLVPNDNEKFDKACINREFCKSLENEIQPNKKLKERVKSISINKRITTVALALLLGIASYYVEPHVPAAAFLYSYYSLTSPTPTPTPTYYPPADPYSEMKNCIEEYSESLSKENYEKSQVCNKLFKTYFPRLIENRLDLAYELANRCFHSKNVEIPVYLQCSVAQTALMQNCIEKYDESLDCNNLFEHEFPYLLEKKLDLAYEITKTCINSRNVKNAAHSQCTKVIEKTWDRASLMDEEGRGIASFAKECIGKKIVGCELVKQTTLNKLSDKQNYWTVDFVKDLIKHIQDKNNMGRGLGNETRDLGYETILEDAYFKLTAKGLSLLNLGETFSQIITRNRYITHAFEKACKVDITNRGCMRCIESRDHEYWKLGKSFSDMPLNCTNSSLGKN